MTYEVVRDSYEWEPEIRGCLVVSTHKTREEAEKALAEVKKKHFLSWIEHYEEGKRSC